MNKKSRYTLFGGILLFIIAAPYIFTRPAFFSSWDLSNTGQIGDTIGGITAPIISLLGAILVYYSFQAQIKANKIQSDALEDEKQQIAKRNQFEKYLLSFDEIKKSLSTVEFIVEHPGRVVSSETFSQPIHVTYHGLNAMNEYVLRVEGGRRYWGQNYDTFGLEITFQFILKAIIDLIERIELYLIEKDDREFLLKEISLFYNGFLKKFAERIIACYPYLEGSVAELHEVKTKIENKIGA
jgi:hypothetical protein